jgi:FkbM family methyltransferase
MTERTYGNNINNIITEYQLEPNNCPSQVFDLKKDKNNELVIVVVGAHDGVNGEQYGFMEYLDNIENFKLYLIEPIKEWFDGLFEVYGKFGNKVTYLNYAITENSGESRMIDQGVMSKIGDGNLVVDTKSWDDFINENNINQIDILLLDCEGYEFHILKQIEFETISPKNIRYEYLHLPNNTEVDQFLINKKYSIEFDTTDPQYNKVAKL